MRAAMRWWRLATRTDPSDDAASFVTWRLGLGQAPLSPAERDLVTEVLLRCRGDRCHLLAFVVMDDHVHLLARPRRVPLGRLVETVRRQSSQLLQRLHRRRGAVWDGQIEIEHLAAPEAIRARAIYIVGNPWKRWPFVQSYRWVWEEGE